MYVEYYQMSNMYCFNLFLKVGTEGEFLISKCMYIGQ